MKLLLCIPSSIDVDSFLAGFSATKTVHPTLPFIFSAKVLHHEVDILQTGGGIFQTSYLVTKALSLQKYHLALKISLGNSYNEAIPVGAVLNIVNEKPGNFGTEDHGEWKDLYDLGLLSREEAPHYRGGFINLNNSYINLFNPIKKVVGVTVNHYADRNRYLLYKDRYKAECETTDGLGFVYPCMYEKQNFYHLCVMERNLPIEIEDKPKALISVQNELSDLIRKL